MIHDDIVQFTCDDDALVSLSVTSLSVTTPTQVSHNRYEKSLILLSTHTVYAPEAGAITDGGLVNECIYIHQITSI